MRLSKTKINTYLKCPREFKYTFIDEIIVPPTEPMVIGNQVHLIAEIFLKKFKDKPPENIKYYLEVIARQEHIDPLDIDEHLDSLTEFFNDIFVDNNYRLFSQEEYIIDEDYNLSGITDLVLEDEKGDLTIIDYKTGNSSQFSKYRLELVYYKLLIEKKYNKNVIKVGIFFTRDNKLRLLDFKNVDNKRKYITDKEISEAIETLYTVRQNIKEEIFPPNNQYLCRYCPYLDMCIKEHDD